MRARRAATEGRWTFRGWGGEQPNGRTGPIVANRLSGSGRPADIAMVEATDFANRDDFAEFRPLNWAAVGRILVEREVSTRPVVVREVASQGAAQVPFANSFGWTIGPTYAVTPALRLSAYVEGATAVVPGTPRAATARAVPDRYFSRPMGPR